MGHCNKDYRPEPYVQCTLAFSGKGSPESFEAGEAPEALQAALISLGRL